MEDLTAVEKPIMFSGEMVRAILAGRKTQTRRVIRPQPTHEGRGVWTLGEFVAIGDRAMRDHLFHDVYGTRGTPYGGLYETHGDRIWVRETFVLEEAEEPRDGVPHLLIDADEDGNRGEWGDYLIPHYRATEPEPHIVTDDQDDFDDRTRWKPAIFMPRWASRITLEITDVRAQRLQEVSELDALAEGIIECDIPADEYGPKRVGYMVGPDDGKSLLKVSPRDVYRELWDKINGKRHGCDWLSNPWVWAITFKLLSTEQAAKSAST